MKACSLGRIKLVANPTPGAQGVQGLRGTQGVQGAQGAQGVQGAQGAQGTQGLRGPTGSQGIKGNNGERGIQGIAGTKGPTGAQGIQGIQGIQGSSGVKGSTADLIIGYTHLFSDTWKYEYRLNGTMRVAWFTNYTPSTGQYSDNNPTNSPDATGADRKGTYLKLTFTVPTSQKILVRFMFPLQPLGSTTSVYNFQTTLSTSPGSVVPLRSSGIASDYYEAWTHAAKDTLNFSHNEVVQFYIDASKLDTPKTAGSSMTVYFCAQGQSLGNSHRMDFGTQNANGSHGGVTSAAIMGIAYSLDDVPIYEPAL